MIIESLDLHGNVTKKINEKVWFKVMEKGYIYFVVMFWDLELIRMKFVIRVREWIQWLGSLFWLWDTLWFF